MPHEEWWTAFGVRTEQLVPVVKTLHDLYQVRMRQSSSMPPCGLMQQGPGDMCATVLLPGCVQQGKPEYLDVTKDPAARTPIQPVAATPEVCALLQQPTAFGRHYWGDAAHSRQAVQILTCARHALCAAGRQRCCW